MTIGESIKWVESMLKEQDIEEADIETKYMTANILGKTNNFLWFSFGLF